MALVTQVGFLCVEISNLLFGNLKSQVFQDLWAEQMWYMPDAQHQIFKPMPRLWNALFQFCCSLSMVHDFEHGRCCLGFDVTQCVVFENAPRAFSSRHSMTQFRRTATTLVAVGG